MQPLARFLPVRIELFGRAVKLARDLPVVVEPLVDFREPILIEVDPVEMVRDVARGVFNDRRGLRKRRFVLKTPLVKARGLRERLLGARHEMRGVFVAFAQVVQGRADAREDFGAVGKKLVFFAQLLPFAFLGIELFVDLVDPAQALGLGLKLFLVFGRLRQKVQLVLPGKPRVAHRDALGLGGAESVDELGLVGGL